MTTKVRVEAHCGEDVRVKITLTGPDVGHEDVYLKDGQSSEEYVYDNREIAVKEIMANETDGSDAAA